MATSTHRDARKEQQQQSFSRRQLPSHAGGGHDSINSLVHNDSAISALASFLKEEKAKASGHGADDETNVAPPALHRFHHNRSILAIALTDDYIFSGTQGGEILVYALDSYELVQTIDAHRGSVLGFCAVPEERLLFSSAGDRFVNVWDSKTLQHIAAIYSYYDVGDIFCVSYSKRLQTVYLGSQNTSIQWFDLKTLATQPPPDLSSHPWIRTDRFFDSYGPGGVVTPRRHSTDPKNMTAQSGRDREIQKHHIHQFAHYGYVYCTLIRSDARFGVGDRELLISGGGDGTIKLWTLDEDEDADNKGRIREHAVLDDGREGGESVLAINIDSAFLYSGRVDGEINVWDLETKQLLRSFKAHDVDILTLAIGDGFLFSAAVDGTSKKFDQRHECIADWKAHDGMTLASTFTRRKGRSLYITGGNDDTVAIWNTAAEENTKNSSLTKPDNEQLIETLRTFISYRTVSSDARYKADCRRAASFLRSIFKGLGAATEMIRTDNGFNPIVFARFTANRQAASKTRRRILFYGHYDVVSATNRQAEWKTDPFTLEGRDGYLYGRGVSDNKGPVIAAAYAVAEVLAQKMLDADVVFLIEGEEESGSRGFKDAVRRNKDIIGDVDWILLANSYWIDDEVPCLTYGLRGVIHASIEVLSREPDLHSGVDGSRLLDEPLKDLIMVLSKLNGPQGKIMIPGFYDSIPPVSKNELELYDEISTTLIEKTPELGNTEDLTNSLLQRWRNPTLTVHGFNTSGSDNSTIIPHKATATLSLRLVPNQVVENVAAVLTRFVRDEFAKLESQNSIKVNINHKADPWLGDYTNELFQALEKAVMDVWSQTARPRRRSSAQSRPGSSNHHPTSTSSGGGSNSRLRMTSHSNKSVVVATSSTLAYSSSSLSSGTVSATATTAPEEYFSDAEEANSPTSPSSSSAAAAQGVMPRRRPLYIREGGSIPAIRFLEEEFDAAAAQLPCGQASDNAHLANERLRVTNLWNSKEVFRRVFLTF